MRITQVTVGVQRIINLGNYENARYECTQTAEVEEGEDPAEVYNQLRDICRANISQEVERLQPQKTRNK